MDFRLSVAFDLSKEALRKILYDMIYIYGSNELGQFSTDVFFQINNFFVKNIRLMMQYQTLIVSQDLFIILRKKDKLLCLTF
ncbi:hypothetical protein ASD24_15090 [Paenibacillus sp. Root52]|nr:hypothetical protein ASD24_15090 [Paenibacillus sp. Root52]